MVNLSSGRSKKLYLKNHFSYEVNELLNSKLLYDAIDTRSDSFGPVIKALYGNTKIEHTLLHIRNLYEFYFVAPSSQYRYPRAEDFIDRSKFQAKYNGCGNYMAYVRHKKYLDSRFYTKVNNQVSHLGSKRTMDKIKKSWHLDELVIDTLKVTKEFLDKIDSYYYKTKPKTLTILKGKVEREL